MILDPELLSNLALEFLRKRGTNYITGTLLPGEGGANLGEVANRFTNVYATNLYASNLVYNGTAVDSVAGYYVSATPVPNRLLPLNASGVFPASVYPEALLKSGGIMTGNIAMSAGGTLDGVDLDTFKADYDAHMRTGHGNVGEHSHSDAPSGGLLARYAFSEGYGGQPAHAANRLNRTLLAGSGLRGGGMLDQDLRMDISAGGGLRVNAANMLVLEAPLTLGVDSANATTGGHAHAVDASSDPAGASLLRSDTSAGLRLQRLALGAATIPTLAGSLAASGEVQANRIVSTQDTFVGNDLSVGSSVLATARARTAVYINRETADPLLQGALTVRPGAASQRGLVVQGKANQERMAPLLSVANDAGSELLRVLADGTMESGSPAFVSGQRGWRITSEGDAEFRNFTARGELHTSVFVANEIHAAGGTLAVMPTGTVDSPSNASDNLIGATFNLVVSGNPNAPAVCDFALNDVLRIKSITGLQEN